MSVGKLQRYGIPFSNVVATGTATNLITPGRTLENFRLKLGGTTFTKAMISLVRIKANGKTVIEATGTELDKMNAYRGETSDASFLDVQFADYKMMGEVDRMVGAFDTSLGIANITTEVTINGATAPVLTPILTESAAQKSADGSVSPFAGLMTKILRYPFSVATGGVLPLTVPFGPQNGAIIKRVHVATNGGLMTEAVVKEDGLVVHESNKAENEFEQKKFGRVPQTNFYTIDFCADGNVRKALDTRQARSLEWLLKFSAAESGNVLIEYLDPLGNL
ncbi:major capsid protein P2 [Aquabacterium sp.]|uniref:major capsid protein P2 n=1 Tax=Aquabacterium sp. TaxID=1872578 RepID=UPI0025C226AF|nr:major capsid protein P2 [Aquabacterium sp.]